MAAIALCVAPTLHAQEAAERRFNIFGYRIVGNTVLEPAVLDRAVYEFLGPQRSYLDVEAARTALEKTYHSQGYMTVAVTIPEQTVTTDAVVQLEVKEQRVGQLSVSGTEPRIAEKIRHAAASMAPGTTPNFKQVEQDILALNRVADRRVTPNLQLGEQPETIDIELQVEERPPLHMTAELNNRGSSNTTDLRANTSIGHHNLWGRGDMLTLSAQTAPDRREDGEVYSASYLGWLPDYRTQLLIYGVRTESDIAVLSGVGGDVLNVLGSGDIIGLRAIRPLPPRGTLFHTLSFGIDRKDFGETLRLDGGGCLPTDPSDEPVREDEDRDRFCSTPIEYWPMSLRYQANWLGSPWQHELSVAGTFGTRGLGDDVDAFDAKRLGARPNFFHIRLEAAETFRFQNDIQLFAQLRSQYARGPLISIEHFGIGGLDTVRGYFESEGLGDYGAALQFEVRSPSFATWLPMLEELRLHLFADYGVVRKHATLIEEDRGDTLFGAGVGLRLQVMEYLFGSVDFARALRPGSATDDEDSINAFFRVWGEF